jgi:hypothetical protein
LIKYKSFIMMRVDLGVQRVLVHTKLCAPPYLILKTFKIDYQSNRKDILYQVVFQIFTSVSGARQRLLFRFK